MVEKNRIEWIDMSKGIAIFLMVIGHTSIPEIGAKFIWSFHMPLFFIVSGFLYKEENNRAFFPFLRKISKSLLIPYLFFTIINYVGFKYICNPGSINVDVDKIYLTGWEGIALWFVQVLFVTELIYNRLIWLRMKCGTTIVVILLLISYFFGYYLFIKDINIPYTMSSVFHAFVFFSVGGLLKTKIKEIASPCSISILKILLTFIFAQFMPRLDLCSNNYGIFFLNTLLACFGTLGVFSISKNLSRDFNGLMGLIKKFFLWAGENTYVIMGISQLVIIMMKDRLSPVLSLPNAVDSVMRYLLLWPLLIFLSLLLNKYVPFFVGKKK